MRPSASIQILTATVYFLPRNLLSEDRRSDTSLFNLPVYQANTAPPVPVISLPPNLAARPKLSPPAVPSASKPSCCEGAGALSGAGGGSSCGRGSSTFSGGGGGGGVSSGGGGGLMSVTFSTTCGGLTSLLVTI